MSIKKNLNNYNKFNADLEKEKIPIYPSKHQGQVYYKDEKPYYGPKTTYKNIPQIDKKFSVYLYKDRLPLRQAIQTMN